MNIGVRGYTSGLICIILCGLVIAYCMFSLATYPGPLTINPYYAFMSCISSLGLVVVVLAKYFIGRF